MRTGKSHDQRAGLPAGVSPTDETYGLPTLKVGSASELVNPLKSRKQVQRENSQGIDLYKKSHGSYDVGKLLDNVRKCSLTWRVGSLKL